MAADNDALSMQAPAGVDPASLMSMAAPLAAKGEDLLKTGQVTIAQAKAAQKKLGLDPDTVHAAFQKAISGGMPDQQPPPSDAFNSVLLGKSPQPMLNPSAVPTMGAKVGDKTTSTKSGQTATQDASKKGVRNSYADATQAGDTMDVIRNTPEAQSQREGISKMENILAMNQAHQRPNDAWIKSLLAYGDSMNGTNQAASFEPQAAKQNESMLKFANDIQQRKGDYAKSIEDALTKLRTGSDTNSMNQKLLEQLSINSGNPTGRGGAYLKSLPIRAGKDFDMQLKDSTNSVEALNRGDSFLNDTKIPLTYQALNQVQQDISAGLAKSGTPTDAKMALDMQHVFAGALQNLETNYSGKFDPKKDDLRTKVPEVVAQINKGLQKIRADFNDRMGRDADQISQTYEPLYGDIPGLKEVVEAKKSQLAKRHPRSADFNDTGIFQPPAAAGGGGTAGYVAPKGDRKTWSKADLDAYEAHLHAGGAPVGAGNG